MRYEMFGRQQGIQHARIVALTHVASQRQIGLKRIVLCQLLWGEYTDAAQIGRDGLADIGQVFQSVDLSFGITHTVTF